jgi:hypothetical protein
MVNNYAVHTYTDIRSRRIVLVGHVSFMKRRQMHAILLQNRTQGLESASELYQTSDRRLSAKLVLTLADRGYRVVSATNPHGH